MTSPVLGEAGGEDGTDLIMWTGKKGDSPVMLNLYLVGLSTDRIPKTLVTLQWNTLCSHRVNPNDGKVLSTFQVEELGPNTGYSLVEAIHPDY